VNSATIGDYIGRAALRREAWDGTIILTAGIAIAANIYGLMQGITIVLPHVFYIPIVIAAYWHPKRGVPISLIIAALYIAPVAAFYASDTLAITGALARGVVFVAAGAVVSHLSGRLKVQETRYRSIFDNSEAGILLFNLDTLAVEEVNPRCAEVLGYSPAEAARLPMTCIWPGLVDQDATIDRLIQGEGFSNLETRITRRDGTERSILLSAGKLPDQLIACTMLVDVTVQKQMEDRLRQSEEDTRAIINSVDVGIVVSGMDGKIVEVNEAGLHLYGARDRDDLLGKDSISIVAAQDLERAKQNRASVIETGRLSREEFLLQRKDGSTYPAEVTRTTLKDKSGRATGVVVAIRDISAQKQREEEVRRHNRQLSVVHEVVSALAAAHTLDEMARTSLEKTLDFTHFEAGALSLVRDGTGVPEMLCSLNHTGVTVPSPGTVDDPLFSPVLLDGKVRYIPDVPAEYSLQRDAGIRSVAGIPLVGDGTVIGGMFLSCRDARAFSGEDIAILESIGQEVGRAMYKATLQEELEQALSRSRTYLEQATAANDEANLYIDILAHDINNANTIAIGYAQILIEVADGPTKEFAQKLLISVQQSVEIIRNVTTLRKLRHEATVLRPIVLDSVIREVQRYFSDARIVYGGTDVTVSADDLIDEIFTNLIGNSIKCGGPEVEITIRVEQQGDEVGVTVADTGPGIADDLKPRIFQRYQRGTSKKSGKGLGLYIVKMLVERYGGSVWAEDRVLGDPGKGTAITFTVKRYGPEST